MSVRSHGTISALSETLPVSTGNTVPGTTGNESFATVTGEDCQETKWEILAYACTGTQKVHVYFAWSLLAAWS